MNGYRTERETLVHRECSESFDLIGQARGLRVALYFDSHPLEFALRHTVAQRVQACWR